MNAKEKEALRLARAGRHLWRLRHADILRVLKREMRHNAQLRDMLGEALERIEEFQHATRNHAVAIKGVAHWHGKADGTVARLRRGIPAASSGVVLAKGKARA